LDSFQTARTLFFVHDVIVYADLFHVGVSLFGIVVVTQVKDIICMT